MARQALFFVALAHFLRLLLQPRLVGGAEAAAEEPAELAGEICGAEALVESADDLDAGGDFGGGLEFAEAFVAGGDDFREVLVQGEGADVGEEG